MESNWQKRLLIIMNNLSFEYLFTKLGYRFKDLNLLKMALSHRSVRGFNNERLEFLGDSVLNFIMTDHLYATQVNAKEGDLSRLRAHLVCEDSLAEIARQLELGDYLQLGMGELKSGGFRRQSILADTLEAILGAIYLESGITICQQLILAWFDAQLANLSAQTIHKDSKTLLQEYLQARKKSLPHYEIDSITGEAHQQTFNVKCTVENITHIAEGQGSSRRRAEQEAARHFLEWIQQHD